MSHAMIQSGTVCLLEDFGALRFTGAEAGKFLQGQLSNDVASLAPGTLLRAGLHNPQGRTLAVLGLIGAGQDDILAVLPLELMSTVSAHLRRYVLRSKVTISDDSARYRVLGVAATHAATDTATDAPGLRVAYGLPHEQRTLLLQEALAPAPAASMPREQWRALDIAAGLPQVYSATSGQFVAQMLNLDCINAISFTKGCYTGQEVIARAHYRGRIKRRMQRFVSHAPLRLAAGDTGRLIDGRSYRVVDAVQRADGLTEFLAVASLPGTAQEADETGQLLVAGGVLVGALPLPYTLPE
jgi:folate-binding protein YgfZ